MTCSTFIILGFSLPFIFIARWTQLSWALPDCSKVSLPGLYDLSEALASSYKVFRSCCYKCYECLKSLHLRYIFLNWFRLVMNSIILPLFNHKDISTTVNWQRNWYRFMNFIKPPFSSRFIILFASNIYRNRYKLLCSLFQYFVNFISRVFTSMCRNFCPYCNSLTHKIYV
jgi:hypothetical protein